VVIAGLSRVIEGQDLSPATLHRDRPRRPEASPAEFPHGLDRVAIHLRVHRIRHRFISPGLPQRGGAAAVFAIGAYFPRWYIGFRQRKRLAAFSEQLPNTITLLANSLRAGSSFLQGWSS
jgi:hypothetical protein